jgi:hypothetical protein
MKKTITAFFAASIVGISIQSFSDAGKLHSNVGGAPGAGTCAVSGCHGGTARTDGDIILEAFDLTTDSIVTEFEAGKEYGIGISQTKESINKFGFALSANIGTLSKLDAADNTMKIVGNYATHTASGTAATNNEVDWEVKWTAPSTPTGNVTFQLFTNATNSNNTTSGDTIYAENLTLTLKSATALNEVLKSAYMHLFPMPAHDLVNVQYELNQSAQVVVNLMDLSGKMVQHVFEGQQTAGAQQLRISTDALQSGIYLIQMQINGNAITKKLIVQ